VKAHAEITGLLIRLYDDDDSPLVGGYSFCVHVQGDEGVATLKGMVAQGFTKSCQVAIWDCLRSYGFRTVRWSRRSNDGQKIRKYERRL